MTDWAWLEEIEKRVNESSGKYITIRPSVSDGPGLDFLANAYPDIKRLLHAVKVMREGFEDILYSNFIGEAYRICNEALEQAAKGEE